MSNKSVWLPPEEREEFLHLGKTDYDRKKDAQRKKKLRERIKAGDTTVPPHVVEREKNRGKSSFLKMKEVMATERARRKEL